MIELHGEFYCVHFKQPNPNFREFDAKEFLDSHLSSQLPVSISFSSVSQDLNICYFRHIQSMKFLYM